MTDNNTKNLSDQNRVKLRKILNECIEKGWKPFEFYNEHLTIKSKEITCDKYFICFIAPTEGDTFYKKQYYDKYLSYHELFSKDSGIMEFVKWECNGEMLLIDYEFIQDEEGNPGIDARNSIDYHDPRYHYMIMGPMTAEEKIQYFLDNAILPQ